MRFGPAWPEADGHLAFDAASGDFWVLTGLARRIVARLVADGALDATELRDRILGDGCCAAGVDWDQTLRSVIDCGLLEVDAAATVLRCPDVEGRIAGLPS